MSQPAEVPVTLRRSLRTGVVITSLIGAGTAWVSYIHALDVARSVGATGAAAWILPTFADGLIVICTVLLYAAAQVGAARPWPATAGLGFGIAVTITMNVAAGAYRGLPLMLVDALAPIVFLITLEALVRLFRLGRPGQEPDKPAHCPHGVPTSPDEAIRMDWDHRVQCLGEKPSYMSHGARWGIDRRKLPEIVGAALNGDGQHD